MNTWSTRILVSMLALALVSAPSFAADKKDKAARRAAQQMQQMKQQMEQEKAAMQAQFDAQKKALEDKLKAEDDELKAAQSALIVSKRKNKELEISLSATKDEKSALETKLQQTQVSLDDSQKKLAEMTTNYQKSQADLKFNDNQRKQQLVTGMESAKQLQSCVARNDKLYHYGLNLIQVYEKPSDFQTLLRDEKFTQIKRVELENLLQDFRDKIDEERVSISNP